MGSGPDAVRLGWGGTTSYAGRLNEFIGQLASPPADGITLIATPQAARLSEEVKNLQAERKQVRARIEKLLGQIDELGAV